MPKLNFPGVPVYMNGQNYYIPSLSTRQFRENAKVLSTLPTQAEGETAVDYALRVQDAILPVVVIAIQRNYPDVTLDNLLDWLDNSTLMDAWRATQSASGMTPVNEGE